MHRAVAGTALAAALVIAAPATAAGNPSQDVARARGEFTQGNYKGVIGLLVPQLYPKSLIGDEAELKEARYLLAEAYFFSDQRDKAEEQFVALLFIDPEFKLDPVLEDPDIYGFFEAIRTEKKAELEEILRLKREAAAAARAPKTQIIFEREIRDRSWTLNLVPFGVGQFANGDRRKGYLFLGAQALFGGISAGIFTYQALLYGIPSRVPEDEATAVQQLQVIQVGAGAAFFIAYAWSVLDAFQNQKPKIIETRREVPIEKPKTSFVVPLLTPDTVGVGVTWEF